MKKLLLASVIAFCGSAAAAEFPVDFASYGFTTNEYRLAETSIHFNHYANTLGDGVNKFTHLTELVSVESQSVPRTNNDTLYSLAVVDTRKGASFTLPDTGERYISATIFDEHHYPYGVIHQAGTHKLDVATNYAFIIIRTAVNSTSQDDINYVTGTIQPQLSVNAISNIEYAPADYDADKLSALRDAVTKEGIKLTNFSDLYHERPESQSDTHKEWMGLIATTVAWGIIPAAESTFIMQNPMLPADKCYNATYEVPPHNAFWSITAYDNKSMLFSNTHSIINEDNVTFNEDNSFTVNFGSEEQCGTNINRLDTVDNFNFLFRVYKATMAELPAYEANLPALVPVS
ncbi:DUF1254 domain-containing protein [Psychromonas aquimarina]|uniref:DUF1254 domain-containing protein n=1 Tax=Psychromonas aquimarina TaxID=444919 RepID=UPI0004220D61|nr:DUF1254 domain-containing protein [Psychromonas aquimarina]